VSTGFHYRFQFGMRLNPTAPQNSHSLTAMLTLYLHGRYAGVLSALSFPIKILIYN